MGVHLCVPFAVPGVLSSRTSLTLCHYLRRASLRSRAHPSHQSTKPMLCGPSAVLASDSASTTKRYPPPLAPGACHDSIACGLTRPSGVRDEVPRRSEVTHGGACRAPCTSSAPAPPCPYAPMYCNFFGLGGHGAPREGERHIHFGSTLHRKTPHLHLYLFGPPMHPTRPMRIRFPAHLKPTLHRELS